MSRGQLEAAYLGIESTDVAAVGNYLRDVVGLMPGDAPADGGTTWRVDDKVQRVFVKAGRRDDALCIGFEAASTQIFDRVAARLTNSGYNVETGSPAILASRRVRDLVHVHTPWGVSLELVTGLADAETPFASSHFPEGLITKGQGFGHFVFLVGNAQDYEASRHFAMEGLGLGLSDWLRMPIPSGEMHVSFFHCNQRHHSLAVGFLPMPDVPKRLHHVNFEVTEVVTVGIAYERALRAGTPIANTMGQHANDRMVSFYSVSPGGWQVEIGATGRTVGEDWHDVREYDRISEWGHQPPDLLAGMLVAGAQLFRP